MMSNQVMGALVLAVSLSWTSAVEAQPSRDAPPPAPAPTPAQVPAPPVSGPSGQPVAEGNRAERLNALKATLATQLVARNVAKDEAAKAVALLDQLLEMVGRKVQTEAENEAVIREYLARGGELRDLLYDLGLPDPGDILPPGPRSRLGIVFNTDGPRVVVGRVLPQYRADKMGIRVGDVILSLNGKPAVPKTFVELVVKSVHPYRIEIMRHGRRQELVEPEF